MNESRIVLDSSMVERWSCSHTEEIEGKNRIVLDSSMVEHAAVNRGVVGSSPTRGVKKNLVNMGVCKVFCYKSSHIKND